MYENIRKNLHHDEQAAYIDRQESEPLRSHEPLRKKNLIKFNLPERHDSCCGGTRFPGEKHLEILPDMSRCLPSSGCSANPLRFMKKKLDYQREKLDIFRGLNYMKPDKRRRY